MTNSRKMTTIKLPALGWWFLALVITGANSQSDSNILQFVDPLIGTANGGHVFAGATLPFGMAKAVADSVNDGQGGYATDGGKIKGFSHMHDSGTGGVSHHFILPMTSNGTASRAPARAS